MAFALLLVIELGLGKSRAQLNVEKFEILFVLLWTLTSLVEGKYYSGYVLGS